MSMDSCGCKSLPFLIISLILISSYAVPCRQPGRYIHDFLYTWKQLILIFNHKKLFFFFGWWDIRTSSRSILCFVIRLIWSKKNISIFYPIEFFVTWSFSLYVKQKNVLVASKFGIENILCVMFSHVFCLSCKRKRLKKRHFTGREMCFDKPENWHQ